MLEPRLLARVEMSPELSLAAHLAADDKVKWFVEVPFKGHENDRRCVEISDTTAQSLLLAKSLSK